MILLDSRLSVYGVYPLDFHRHSGFVRRRDSAVEFHRIADKLEENDLSELIAGFDRIGVGFAQVICDKFRGVESFREIFSVHVSE